MGLPEAILGSSFNRKEFKMKNEMSVAVLDLRDPFSQALAYLFKETGNIPALKAKMRVELVPLVLSVARKIGAIGTERSVSARAIPVFTGVVSLHLADLTKGGQNVREWASEISVRDLKTLFRKGYTLLDKLLNNTSRKGKAGRAFREVESFAERMESYATVREEGIWMGYQLYTDFLVSYQGMELQKEFAGWLVDKAGARKELRELLDSGLGLEELVDSAEIINRILLNVINSGRISFSMSFKKVKEVVGKARKDKKWRERGLKRYAAFVEELPPRFKESLTTTSTTLLSVGYILHNLHLVEDPHGKKFTQEEDIDAVCLNVGINSPGMSLVARKELGK